MIRKQVINQIVERGIDRNMRCATAHKIETRHLPGMTSRYDLLHEIVAIEVEIGRCSCAGSQDLQIPLGRDNDYSTPLHSDAAMMIICTKFM